MQYNYQYFVDFCGTHLSGTEKALDFGCGKGGLVEACQKLDLDVYGTDIFYKDGGTREDVKKRGLYGTKVKEINDGIIDFPDDMFSLVVSNQVFEHVQNLDQAVSEIARVMKPGAVLHTLFPVRETWWEGHFGLPFIQHFPKDSQLRIRYAKLYYRFGGYHRKNRSPQEWAEYICNWIDEYTCYRSLRDILDILQKHGFVTELTDESYVKQRFIKSISSKSALLGRLFGTGIGTWLLRKVYFRRGGVVISAKLAES